MRDPVRLTQLAKRAGCAAKQPPGYLLPLLSALPPILDPNVLVGSSTADDAAVYKLSDELALVLTTDFFTPIVDRPYDFGAVAAANALSDVYAMGGKPLAALSLVGFPDDKLPVEVLAEILRGATDKAAEAGIAIVGGHTIKSEEPIFGLAVIGTVHPAKVLTNAGARPGDAPDPDQADRPRDHHDRGEERRGPPGSDRRGARGDDDAQPRRVRGPHGIPGARSDRRHRLRPARAPAQHDRGERRHGADLGGRRPGAGGGAGVRPRRHRPRRHPRQLAVPRRLGHLRPRRCRKRSSSSSATRRPPEACWPPCRKTAPTRCSPACAPPG